MANSREYNLLVKRIYFLKKGFLPTRFSLTGVYSKTQLDRAKAFRLLVHAEIEYFFEEICKSTMLKKVNQWQVSRRSSEVILCLLACYHSGWNISIIQDSEPHFITNGSIVNPRDRVEDAIQAALNGYLGKVSSNNGIKQENLKMLLYPIGVRSSDFDPTWLATIDSFAQQRGVVAHNGIRFRHVINPQDEWNNVINILQGISDLDEIITRIRRVR